MSRCRQPTSRYNGIRELTRHNRVIKTFACANFLDLLQRNWCRPNGFWENLLHGSC